MTPSPERSMIANIIRASASSRWFALVAPAPDEWPSARRIDMPR
tara:strand:+ start:347 stop:478 length:132 start_codon:yes stop_codon:yes gene_type:complete